MAHRAGAAQEGGVLQQGEGHQAGLVRTVLLHCMLLFVSISKLSVVVYLNYSLPPSLHPHLPRAALEPGAAAAAAAAAAWPRAAVVGGKHVVILGVRILFKEFANVSS